MKQINISGVIGWDVLPESVRKSLKEANGGDVNLLVSSPGGLVSDALEIFNMVRNYKGHVTATLSGFAMSAASYIPLAADKVVAEDNAVYMIHNVHGGVYGDHNEILHYGEMCKGLSSMLTKAYAKFTGKNRGELAELMDKTTFYYGDEIVDAGFAHEVVESETEQDQEEATATAKLAFQETTAKLTEDQNTIKKDLSRAMALGELAITPPIKEKTTMNLEELKEKHADLVALIVDEALVGQEGKLAQAEAHGAKAERERIQAVNEQVVPGHEELVAELAFDGKTTGPEAAVKVIQAVNAEQKKQAESFKEEAPPAAQQPADNGEPKSFKEPKTEEQAKQAWDASEELQTEFMGDFELYKCAVLQTDGVVFKTLKNGRG